MLSINPIKYRTTDKQLPVEVDIVPTDYWSMRIFETGATRDSDENKPHYSGYLSPLVLKAFGEYMLKHETQADGKRREPGNWKRGMSLDCFMDSGFRHFQDWFMEHDGYASREGLIDALCGLLFNVQGYLHETLKRGLDKSDKQV